MNDNKIYKVSDLKFKTSITEDEQAFVDSNLDAALFDLANRVKDPSVQGLYLTAVFKGADDTIDIAELTLNRNGDASEPSRMSYTLAEWHHRVPESVNEVFDNLAGNLGVYYNDMTEPDDNAETMSISVGDPTSEIILTARTDSLEQNFFAPTETDDEECEDDEC